MRNPVRRIALFALIQLVFLSACGGGSNDLAPGGGSGQTIASAGPNVASLIVDAGVPGTQGTFNLPFVTVTVCAPGSTTNCQSIDHISVDTGSYGLRVISSVLNSTLLAALPQEVTAGLNVPIVECTIFGDGYSWGSIRTADIGISSEKAAGVPMQVIGDPNFPTVPAACSSNGRQEDTVATFGANGILGVGPFAQDCGTSCVDSTANHFYYSCPTGGAACSDTQVALGQEVANPVASFTTDNNGVIVELPSIPDSGALTVTGALVFGIGTQGNNGLGSATVLTTDPNAGFIRVTYKSVTYADGFLDSGSNLNYFNDSAITTCPATTNTSGITGWYCPASQLSLSATSEGANNVMSTVSFNVSNADTLFSNNPSFAAFNDVAAPNPDSQGFDFGLPFFYGRNVFTAIEGMNTSGGMGPYFAY
jgi:hypothetical protein